MSRYLLFAGDDKPAGGYNDYIGSRNSVEGLKKLAVDCHAGGYKKTPMWAHILDVTTMGRLWTLRGGKWFEDDSPPRDDETLLSR